jgi:hypothetical protein
LISLAVLPRSRIIAGNFGRYPFIALAWWQPEFDAWITGARMMVMADLMDYSGHLSARVPGWVLCQKGGWCSRR